MKRSWRMAVLGAAVAAPFDGSYAPIYSPANRFEAVDVTGDTTFRQLVFAGAFEGESDFDLGVLARLPFRVFTLAGPGTRTRLVVDVSHRWV